MKKHVSVPFDKEVLGFYISGVSNFFGQDVKGTVPSIMKDYENKITDKNARNHISYLYNQIRAHAGKLNCIILENGVSDFEKYLEKTTGQSYEINLVVDGNL